MKLGQNALNLRGKIFVLIFKLYAENHLHDSNSTFSIVKQSFHICLTRTTYALYKWTNS